MDDAAGRKKMIKHRNESKVIDSVWESGVWVVDVKSNGAGDAQSEFAFAVIRNDRLERVLSLAGKDDEKMRNLKPDDHEKHLEQSDKTAPTHRAKPHDPKTNDRETHESTRCPYRIWRGIFGVKCSDGHLRRPSVDRREDLSSGPRENSRNHGSRNQGEQILSELDDKTPRSSRHAFIDWGWSNHLTNEPSTLDLARAHAS